MNIFKIVVFIVLIVILIQLIVTMSCKKKEKKNQIEMFKTNEKRQEYIHSRLLEMLELILRIFKEYQIPYFIHSGTLLGAVRENNIISHDDDIDIAIFPENKDFILSKEFNDEIKKYNLKTEMVLQKDIDKEIIKLKYLHANHGIFMDIFVFEEIDDRIQYKAPLCRRIWPRGFFEKEEMYPIKKYKLRTLEVDGPNNPIPYLKRHFGSDWKIPKDRKRDHNDIIKLNETCNGECI